MNLERLSRMGWMEIAGRGRLEAAKWLERVGIAGRPRWNLTLGTAASLTRDPAGASFFEGPSSATTSELLGLRAPESCARTIAQAEEIVRGRFDLLGHDDLQFGDPIDWHLDPNSGRRAPRVHWSRLDPLEPIGGGDCKLVWELNRHQWMVRLGQAYRLTGDERYAKAFAARVREWMRANPPGIGINWASSLEVGLRLISWCWALHLFSGSKSLDSGLASLVAGGIATHAGHVERHLSYYFSPNTHLTGEALALFYAGSLLRDIRQADRWRTLGSRILTEEIERQVLPDGVYFEQSTCYQRYTIETYLHFIALAGRTQREVSPIVRERVGLMLDFLVSLRGPDGTIPQIGDGDGGRLLPLDVCDNTDYTALFSTSAALLGRADCSWAARGISSETLWMLGAGGLAAFDAVTAAPPKTGPSRLFPRGGYVVMAGGRSRRDHQMIFDVGPLGCPVSAGHGHADLLAINCSVFGSACLVDPGTFCYTRDPGWREHFRGSSAHSTVIVDGQSPARGQGPFSWQERPQARLRRWRSTEEFDFADADHDAYARLSDPVVHRRRVLFVKSRYWVIVDDLSGSHDHTVELRYQFGPDYEVDLSRAPWVAARGPAGAGLFAIAFGTVPFLPDLLEGSLD
ncbi:MAG TPA: alginate lyase family protein, partial [Patescibacteria group bacterium]|nr:alginate lyase family protein [Patescibacteria group bacterium]